MRRENRHDHDNPKLNPWRPPPWLALLLSGLLLAACGTTPSSIQSSHTHFLRPTDPPIYRQAADPMVDREQEGRDPGHGMINPEKLKEVYTITVTEMSVRDLLFALARDADINIDVYPGIEGKVTLSAVDQTLPQILERLSNQVNLRYEITDGTIIVSPDLPYLKIYEVDYLNIIRSAKSTNNVSTRLSTDHSNTSGGAADVGNAGEDSNLSGTTLDTESKNQFWQTLAGNIEMILNPDQQKAEQDQGSPPPPKRKRAEGKEPSDLSASEPPVVPDTSEMSVAGKAAKSPGILAINKEAGQISVYASATQHERVQSLLDSVMGSVHRQVMIESTVVEVELSDQFQEGVDWDIMVNTAKDIGIKGIFSNGELFTFGRDPNPASAVVSKQAIRAAIKALETFGNTKVLSSPKIMALNNQPAQLKVVKNRVFFTLESDSGQQTATSSLLNNNTVVTTPVFDTKIHTVPVGLIMNVTPHIAKDGVVTMNVRPTITRVTSEVQDPNPALKEGNNGLLANITNTIPEIEVKEMETIMRVHSGQVAVMGGLMQDEVSSASNGVPVLGRLPGLGTLFGFKDRAVKKSELVIFLRPVIVGHEAPQSSTWAATRPQPEGQMAIDHRATLAQPQGAPPVALMAGAGRPFQPPPPRVTIMAPAPAAPGGSYLDFTQSGPTVAVPSPARMAAQPHYFSQQQVGALPMQPPGQPMMASAPQPYQQQPSYPQQPRFSSAQQPGSALAQGGSPYPATAPQAYGTPSATSEQGVPAYQTAAAYASQQKAALDHGVAAYQQSQQSQFFIDLGSYLKQDHADNVERQIQAIGLPIQQETAMVQGQSYQRVRSGPFLSQEAATEAMAKITNYTGIQARVARF